MSMMVLRRLRHDARRHVVMGLTALLAVTAFVVLTGSAATSRLETTATVDEAFRPAYDLLVRPAGSRSAIEQATGRVRPNYLSGLFGGITVEQADAIGRVPGVSLSAPIAMLGEVLEVVDYPVDVTDLVGDRGGALLRFDTTEHTMRGLASTAGSDGYLYVADSPIHDDRYADNASIVQRIHGRAVPVCRDAPVAQLDSPFAPLSRWSAQCWDRSGGIYGGRAGGYPVSGWPAGRGRFQVQVRFSFPVMVAAVDPAAEAELTGLGDAVVRGRYLNGQDRSGPLDDQTVPVPVLASSSSLVDQTATIRIDRLPGSAVDQVRAGGSARQTRRLLEAAAGTPVETVRVTERELHRHWLHRSPLTAQRGVIHPTQLFTTSPVDYRRGPDGALTAVPQRRDDSVWHTYAYENRPFAPVPPEAADTGYRTITSVPIHRDPMGREHLLALSTVGVFDPGKIASGPALSRVPLETYQPPSAEPADAATRRLLGGRPLLPDTNPAGYLQSPPLLLTTLKAIPAFTSYKTFDHPADSPVPAAPISAVRVRVAGVTGADDQSRERIRLAAEQIRKATGLEVEVMSGSSPHPTTVELPATRHGAPALAVTEDWVVKGVATVVLNAIDRKSIALFLLILVSSAVSVAISATASVRARRTQYGVLSCLGWRPRRIVTTVLADLTTVGVAAGVAGAVCAIPVAVLLDVDLSWWRTILAIPGALLVVLAAGIVPAATAARAVPSDALTPAVRPPRRATRLRGPASLALGFVRRTPGRVAAAALTLALAVGSLTALLGIVAGFHNAVVGSLLGDTVAVQVRGVDVTAGVLVGVLALGGVAEILYLDLREQAASYASLQAAGWRDTTLGALVVYQALLIALVGTIVGAGLGLAAVAWLAAINFAVLLTAAAVALAAILAAAALALLPAASLRRLPTAVLLSEE